MERGTQHTSRHPATPPVIDGQLSLFPDPDPKADWKLSTRTRLVGRLGVAQARAALAHATANTPKTAARRPTAPDRAA